MVTKRRKLMSIYLTKLGMEGTGQAVNRKPDDALKYTHDLLKRAAVDRMDVYMLCGCLGSDLRERRYLDVTGQTFSESVKEVLEVDRNVFILVWDDIKPTQIAPGLLALTAIDEKGKGKLKIRVSGTNKDADKVAHFIVAKKRGVAESEVSAWLVRLEEPHLCSFEHAEDDQSVPAGIMFKTPAARDDGKTCLATFCRLFDAIPDRSEVVAALSQHVD